MRHLRTGTLLSLLALMGMSAAAVAASLSGTYRGTSDQNYRVTIRVAHSRVTGFRFTLRESCSNGSTAIRSHHLNRGVTIPIEHGQFDQTFHGKTTGGSYTIKYRIELTGILSGGRVGGTMQERQNYYRGGAHVATCKSRVIGYGATRR